MRNRTLDPSKVLLVSCNMYVMQADLLKQLQGTNKGATQSSSTAATKTAPKPDVAKLMAEGLRDLADKIEQQPQLLSRAADLMSMDFMDSRAPPAAVRPQNEHTLPFRSSLRVHQATAC